MGFYAGKTHSDDRSKAEERNDFLHVDEIKVINTQ